MSSSRRDSFVTIAFLSFTFATGSPIFAQQPMCADGACDGPLDLGVWSGSWTGGPTALIEDADLPAAPWTPGILPNDDSIADVACGGGHPHQAHHSIVAAGFDPEIPSLSTVAPTPVGNPSSLRLGNRCDNYGAERVSKTFTVAPGATRLQFWYATVLENPTGHSPAEQPGFGVYLLEGSQLLPGRVDLDAAAPGFQDFIFADATNPFFSVKPGEAVVYRDWTCVTMDLSGLEGKTVTLVLANRDCGAGSHWGYTYFDSFCLGCAGTPTGDASFDPARSDCSAGTLCFDYTVPQLPNGTTGKVDLTLETFQNGIAVGSYASGDLTTSGSYCFPNVVPGLSTAIGYDWKATANFTLQGATISPLILGRSGDGYDAGTNNDCPAPRVQGPINPCCPPWNSERLSQMMFYAGSGSIAAPYTLHFKPTLWLQNQMQSYIDYLHALNPAIERITIAWRLHEQGTGVSPTVPLGPHIGTTAFTTWTENGNGVPALAGDPNFFSAPGNLYPMVIGTWYLVHTGIYLEDNQVFFGDVCAENDIWVRIQVITIASVQTPMLQVMGWGGQIRSMPLPLN